MEYTCVALDFDNCLAYYKDGYDGLYKIFTKQGVPESVAREAYELSKKLGGFSLETMLSALKESGRAFDLKTVQKEFDEWNSSSLVLYPDVKDFILRTRSLNIPIAIITQGKENHQKEKLMLVNIPYDNLFTVPGIGEKASALRKIIDLYSVPVVFIDNRADELDAVRKSGITTEDVETVHILRPDNRYGHIEPEFEHRDIKNLGEIFN